MNSVLHSIRSQLVPIRKEGAPFIAIAVALTLFLGWLWTPLFWIFLALTAWCIYFFRDPPRVILLGEDDFVSPADGRVASVGPALPPRELGLGESERERVSVFMDVFNCHVNRAPAAGSVMRIAYRPGRFVNAELDKASEHNERNGIVIETAHGALGVVQIAGLVARRICCWTSEGETVAAGQRIGMIRFGSRLDVYLPPGSRPCVAVGQTAIAGETVIARFGAGAAVASRSD